MTRRDPEPDDDDNGPWCPQPEGAAMTTHQKYGHACTLGALLTLAGAAYSATFNPWLCIPGIYTSAFLAWCASREYTFHRRARAEAQRAERAARGDTVIELPRPCCQFWASSDGAIHGHDCTRPPAARTGLSLAEQTVWGEITAGFNDKDQAA